MGMLVILGDCSLTAEQLECVKVMTESSHSLLQLLNALLDFTKLEADKCELEVFRIYFYQ
jgi:signal transduction histidine kinase